MRCLLWTMLALPAHAAGIRGSESALSSLESAAKDPDYTSEPDIGSMFISAHWDRYISKDGGSEGVVLRERLVPLPIVSHVCTQEAGGGLYTYFTEGPAGQDHQEGPQRPLVVRGRV